MKNQTKSIAENWKMNLIEKLGLEKCKAIVDVAPEWANKFNPETKEYSKTVNVVFLGASYATHIVRSQAGFLGGLIDLNYLRTALADHERTDTCTDIKNHIAPNTKVIER